MINREYGETHLVCDEPLCGNSQPQTYARDEFNEMIADAKMQGWSIRSGRGGWTHKCPDCAVREAVEFDEVDL